MNKQSQKRTNPIHWIAMIAGVFLLVAGLAFSLSVQPALANPPAQGGYPVGTATSTAIPTATLAGGATATLAPTFEVSMTATTVPTLAAPQDTGTPTQLVPVTGADFTNPGGSSMGIWIALWILGMILIGYGLWSRLSNRKHS